MSTKIKITEDLVIERKDVFKALLYLKVHDKYPELTPNEVEALVEHEVTHHEFKRDPVDYMGLPYIDETGELQFVLNSESTKNVDNESTKNVDYANHCKFEDGMHRCRPDIEKTRSKCKGWRSSSKDDLICMHYRGGDLDCCDNWKLHYKGKE